MASITNRHYMVMAMTIAKASYSERLKVGAIIVTKEGIVVPGYNGTNAGQENCCEDEDGKTKANVRHAEMNAILKLSNSTLSGKGAVLYVTHSPCAQCANMIVGLGIKTVYYRKAYRSDEGIKSLTKQGVEVIRLYPAKKPK